MITMFLVSFLAFASSCGVISKLRNLENSATENKYGTLLDCLCRWGKVGHVLDLISDWLTIEPSTPEVGTVSNSNLFIYAALDFDSFHI